MSVSSDDLTRWKDRGADTHGLEDRAATLVTDASEVPPLDAQVLSRIRADVLAQRPRRIVRDFRQFPMHVRLAFVACLLLLSVTTAGGASILWRKYFAPRPPAVKSARIALPDAQAPRPIHRRSQARTEAVPEESSPEAAPAIDPVPHDLPNGTSTIGSPVGSAFAPRSRARSAPRPVPQAGPSPSPPIALLDPIPPAANARTGEGSPPAEVPDPARRAPAAQTEAGLLAQAVSRLRQMHDPRGALATLGQYDHAFPHGALESEALSARLEAVLQLRDLKTALALLDGVVTFSDPLGPDMLLTRAELRASDGRCREALADFTQTLESQGVSRAKPAIERALYGRAVCFGRLGQDVRGRADLVTYQQRFPDGRFATEVARLLNDSTPIQKRP